jgi:leucyl aminopeptidase
MTKINFKMAEAVQESADALVLPSFEIEEGAKLGRAAARIDGLLGGIGAHAVAQGDFKGKKGEMVTLMLPAGVGAKRLVLAGLGKREGFENETLRRLGAALVKGLAARATKIVVALDDLSLGVRNTAADLQALGEGIHLAGYRFDRFMSEAKPAKLKRVILCDARGREAASARAGLKAAAAISEGVAFARDLGNLPGNEGRPRILAAEARKMARTLGLSAKILGEAEMEKAGMGSLLSVSKGSVEDAKLIVLEHNKGKKNLPTICLVGKGLTFDSGGISIKPSGDMDKMRYDKCGGTVVIGAMRAIAALNLPLHVVGIVPSSENMPGGDANKPGDVVTASNGKTIQVLNTDAEGRLILADALVYAQKFNPHTVVDLATLTGACMVALGKHACGLMTRDDELAKELVAAGNTAMERPWRLPLWDEYIEEMKGDSSDLKNLGGRYGGAITAGGFLSHFVGDHRWAHLDIAGVSWDDSHRNYNQGTGATGFGVRLLCEWLRGFAAEAKAPSKPAPKAGASKAAKKTSKTVAKKSGKKTQVKA